MPAQGWRKPKETKAISIAKKNKVFFAEGAKPLDRLAVLVKEPSESAADARRRIVELLRLDDSMLKLVRVADAMPDKRSGGADTFPSLDLLAARAGIPLPKVVGAIAAALCEYGFAHGKLAEAIAFSATPQVMRTVVEQAAKPRGLADRQLLFRMTRHIPAPGGGKGVVVNNQVAAMAKAAIDEPGEMPAERHPLPSFEDSVRETAIAIRTRTEVA